VRLTCLGHAFWLLESGDLRIAMDPVLGSHHTSGLFEIIPRRAIDPSSLRPDFIFVSHAHLDHFDTDSLHRLAQIDPDACVVTPDALVAEVSAHLGFRTVHTAAPGTRIELDGGLVLTLTPSAAPDVEWGIVAEDRTGVAWNLVDTLLRGPDEVRRVRDLAIRGRRVDVALAPLQPMREIALATADFVGFEPSHYRHMLACAAAIDASCVVPSASGDAHAAPFDAMNAWVYPVSAERAAADCRAFAPASRVLVPALGEAIAIDGGDIGVIAGGIAMERGSPEDPRVFRPLDPAPLVDPNLNGVPSAVLRERIVSWVGEALSPAVGRALGRDASLAKLRLVLDVVLPDDRMAFTLDARDNVKEGFDAEYDLLNAVAGSMLLDVIEGRRGWYEPLLAGCLRSSVRGCLVAPGEARPILIGPMFVYEAIPYRLSSERAARWRARSLLEGGRPAAEQVRRGV
jgi:L-ascorbate metabolism protein UlaG (beta-lactamase superfamily)